MGDDQRLTQGESRLRGTREPFQQATDVRAILGEKMLEFSTGLTTLSPYPQLTLMRTKTRKNMQG